jgi:hypothetical protein
MKVHTHHLRCTRPAYGTKPHFDWSANGDSLRELEPVEHIQRDALSVIRSIERAEIVWAAFIFVSAFAGIGLFFAIGGGK